MSNTKMHLTVSDETVTLMNELAGGERKKSEWLEGVVQDIAANKKSGQEMGTLERMQDSLDRIERKLDCLLSASGK